MRSRVPLATHRLQFNSKFSLLNHVGANTIPASAFLNPPDGLSA